jgi:phosphoenolpyruvate carboxykinase (ATP)
MQKHRAAAWLVNTGWSGGPYGAGSRIKLQYTRAIIDAIHSRALAAAQFVQEPVFQFAVPAHCPGVPGSVLMPETSWPEKSAYQLAARKLGGLFQENFAKYADQASAEVRRAGPALF